MKKILALVLALMLALPAGMALTEEEMVTLVLPGTVADEVEAVYFAEQIKAVIDQLDEEAVVFVLGVRDGALDAIAQIEVPEILDEILLPETVGDLVEQGQGTAALLVLAVLDEAEEQVLENAKMMKFYLMIGTMQDVLLIASIPVPEEIAEIALPETIGDTVDMAKEQAEKLFMIALVAIGVYIDRAVDKIKLDTGLDMLGKINELYHIHLPEEIEEIAFADIEIVVSLPGELGTATIGVPDALLEILPETVGDLLEEIKLQVAEELVYEALEDAMTVEVDAELLKEYIANFAGVVLDIIDEFDISERFAIPDEIAEFPLPATVGELVDEVKEEICLKLIEQAGDVADLIDLQAEETQAVIQQIAETVVSKLYYPIPEEIAGIPLPESVGALADNALGTASEIVSSTADLIVDVIDAAAEQAKDLVDQAVEQAKEDAKDLVDQAVDQAQEVIQAAVEDAVEQIAEKLKDAFGGILPTR